MRPASACDLAPVPARRVGLLITTMSQCVLLAGRVPATRNISPGQCKANARIVNFDSELPVRHAAFERHLKCAIHRHRSVTALRCDHLPGPSAVHGFEPTEASKPSGPRVCVVNHVL